MSRRSPNAPCAARSLFEPALRERVALLAGLSADVVADVIANHHADAGRENAGADHARQRRLHRAFVSGGFTAFTSVIAEMVGFDENRANRLVIEDGKFAGRVADPILGADISSRRCANCARNRGFRRTRRWPPATAPTTCRC